MKKAPFDFTSKVLREKRLLEERCAQLVQQVEEDQARIAQLELRTATKAPPQEAAAAALWPEVDAHRAAVALLNRRRVTVNGN